MLLSNTFENQTDDLVNISTGGGNNYFLISYFNFKQRFL